MNVGTNLGIFINFLNLPLNCFYTNYQSDLLINLYPPHTNLYFGSINILNKFSLNLADPIFLTLYNKNINLSILFYISKI
jgi:hypothetical protein